MFILIGEVVMHWCRKVLASPVLRAWWGETVELDGSAGVRTWRSSVGRRRLSVNSAVPTSHHRRSLLRASTTSISRTPTTIQPVPRRWPTAPARLRDPSRRRDNRRRLLPRPLEDGGRRRGGRASSLGPSPSGGQDALRLAAAGRGRHLSRPAPTQRDIATGGQCPTTGKANRRTFAGTLPSAWKSRAALRSRIISAENRPTRWVATPVQFTWVRHAIAIYFEILTIIQSNCRLQWCSYRVFMIFQEARQIYWDSN